MLGFLAFIYFTLILGLFNLVCCIAHIVSIAVNNQSNSSKMLEKAGSSIFLGFYTFFFMIFVGGLGGFHVYLFCNSYTTNEVMKKSFKKDHMHPYLRKNCWLNAFTTMKISKTADLNLTSQVNHGNKEYCNNCISDEAFAKTGALTEFDGASDINKSDMKESISETPSIIHENIRSI